MIFELKNKRTYAGKGDLKIIRLDTPFKPEFYAKNESDYFLFNLPIGNYRIESGIVNDSDLALVYSTDLPAIERKSGAPYKVKYTMGNVKVKAKIYRSLGTIYIDKSYLNYPQYVGKFLLEHEKAHYFYETEKFCDLWAANKMLKLGYNPSQLFDAIDLILGSKNVDLAKERVNFIYENLNQNAIIKEFIQQ